MSDHNPLRFHLDESCDKHLAQGLRLRGIDVTTSHEADLLGATDEMQLEYATSNERVLVTRDDDFIRLHKSGFNHCGVFYHGHSRKPMATIIELIVLHHDVYVAKEMIGRLEYL